MITKKRSINFNAGPATLPTSILEKAQKELLNFEESGMSVMELSHRSKEYDSVHTKAESNLRKLLEIPENYDILFLQGGASLQFAMIPMNLTSKAGTVDLINTGSWSKKALAELKSIGNPSVIASGEDDKFLKLPAISDLNVDPKADYAYMTSNNTIFGTQFQNFPDTGDVPLVVDMSSDILSRPLDISKFGIIFAGAQKNIGPSGVTIVIIRKDLVENGRDDIPKYLQYSTHADANSLYNTPPTFGIYIANLVFEKLLEDGGLRPTEEKNEIKAKHLYNYLDTSDFYYCPVEPDSRSKMNVVFRIKDNNVELEDKLIKEATATGLIGLKGHRSVGGLRASIYNAQTLENITALTTFLENFKAQN